jgi:hypothetical protein
MKTTPIPVRFIARPIVARYLHATPSLPPKVFPRPATATLPQTRDNWGMTACLYAFEFLASMCPAVSSFSPHRPPMAVYGGLVDVIAGFSSPPAVDFPWLVLGYTPEGTPIPYPATHSPRAVPSSEVLP